jgi:hypothetical protein
MNGAAGLATDNFDNARMSVAECIDGNASEKIQVLFAV